MKNSFTYTVIFTFILCFLFVLILSFVDYSTRDTIAANKQFEQEQAILRALGADKVDTLEEVSTKFKSVIQEEHSDAMYYKANFGVPAIAKSFTGAGLWGLINGYIAVSEDLQTVVGFQVTEQNETPGLGARIAEQWFKDQLKNEAIKNKNIEVGVGGTGDADKTNAYIDGVSGATRTSDSIQTILTKEIQTFYQDLQ